jgi:hypothetical protein
MPIKVGFDGFEEFLNTMHRRANIVQQLQDEGRAAAEAYNAAGGRKRDPKTRRYHSTRRQIMRRIHPMTGNQYARAIEHVAYHRFIDWWGSW